MSLRRAKARVKSANDRGEYFTHKILSTDKDGTQVFDPIPFLEWIYSLPDPSK